MADLVISIKNIATVSSSSVVRSSSSAMLSNSYPSDMELALAWEDATKTSNGEAREKAFRKAGLR
jgi:hypothetical protein